MTNLRKSAVVDASALVDALISSGDHGVRTRTLLSGLRWTAPECLLVETFHVLRGRALRAALHPDEAATAVQRLARMQFTIVPTAPLIARMWELRTTISGYDSAYVAAAEQLAVPLITADQRLARSHGPRCPMIVP